MEATSDHEYFKYIPFRCYFDNGYRQKLVKPIAENGAKKTLQDLIKEMFSDRPEGKFE